MSSEILGKGFSLPMQVNERGGIEGARHEEKIRQSILVILGTARGQRVMRPDFGSSLHTLAFAPNTAATANLARHYVEEALKNWEPRIEVSEVRVENDRSEACLRIHLEYRIKATHQSGSLVYPFYLEQT